MLWSEGVMDVSSDGSWGAIDQGASYVKKYSYRYLYSLVRTDKLDS